ncbi:MAG: hypothetical protein ACI92S_001562 [Planctomycetaceae bacterium]
MRTDDWSLSTTPDISERFWASADGLSRAQFTKPEFAYETPPNDMERCHEILIHAADASIAENVQQLIYGGMLLGYPDVHTNKSPNPCIERGSLDVSILQSTPFCDFFQFADNGYLGCRIAEAAWTESKYMYAIEKLKLSWRLDWFTPHSASPRHGQIFDNEHPEFEYHTNAAFAIIAAFSVVEELGLEVRSNSKKPRFTDPQKGDWNPVVRQDIENRLAESGVDTNESFPWVHRGEPTSIEIEMKPILGAEADYADGNVVRDRDLDIVDAIHYVSWLRNFIAAHRFSDLVGTISPYDVFNSQSLARRLLMSSVGYWKHPDFFG